MPQSLSKVYIIFSTKNRQKLIDDSIETSLYEYLGGFCKGLECNPVKIGGHKLFKIDVGKPMATDG